MSMTVKRGKGMSTRTANKLYEIIRITGENATVQPLLTNLIEEICQRKYVTQTAFLANYFKWFHRYEIERVRWGMQ